MTSLTEVPRVWEPAQAELALAMAIVKHKPSGTTVKEYITEIRQSITNVEDSEPIVTDKFFDSARHWRAAYIESRAGQAKMRKAILELQKKHDDLLAKVKGLTPPTKRKVLGELENQLGTSRKRAKHHGSDSQSQQDPENQQQDVNLDHEHEKGVSFLRHISALQEALQEKLPMKSRNEKMKSFKALALKAVLVCKVAERALLNAVRVEITSESQPKDSRAPKNNEPDFIAVKNAVELSFRLVRQALHKVPEQQFYRCWESHRHVIYYMVALFESTMTGLSQYCTAVSKANDAGNGSTVTTGAKQQQQEEEIGGPSRVSTSAQPDKARALVDLLCNMAIQLNSSSKCDHYVIEGVLYLLVDRLGKMLALFTLDDIQPPTNLDPHVPPPAGLAAMREEGISPQTAQLEAKYLILFLRRWLRERPVFPYTSFHPSGPVRLEYGILLKMKKSLLQAVFGKEDPLFNGGLERPATPRPLDCEESPKQPQEFSQWFTGELWSLIGWGILGLERHNSTPMIQVASPVDRHSL